MARAVPGRHLERFPAKWRPVRVKKTRQIKNLEPRSDLIGTEKAPVAFLASQKPQKPLHGPFQSRLALIHSPRTQGHCPGRLLGKPLDGTDRRPKALAAFASGPVFWKARQRFIAGWSSPVARQAHNLKVIGSNPIPATKTTLPGHRPGRVFLWGRLGAGHRGNAASTNRCVLQAHPRSVLPARRGKLSTSERTARPISGMLTLSCCAQIAGPQTHQPR